MFLRPRFYLLIAPVILTLAAGAAVPVLFTVGQVLLAVLVLLVLAEAALLWQKRAITAERTLPDRFSNGDPNDVRISVESGYRFAIRCEMVDEIPFIFQRRDVSFRFTVAPVGTKTLRYQLTPTRRGVYGFGRVRVFVSTRIGLLQRRYTLCQPQDVKVYPSYLMLRQYELLAHSQHLTEMGIKRIRRVGNNTDFEQIKDYVTGDDYRTINWRATARRHQLMVNVYQQERSQQVFCVIDKGRMMQQAFGGMTLFDYAINASLVLSYVAIHKEDRAGLATFSDRFETFVPASRQPGQMQVLQEALYAEQTQFGETDFSALIAGLAQHANRRSLLVLFTSFMSMPALRRQLSFLRQLSLRHRLLVVFFEDEEQRQFIATPATTTEDYYQHVVAEKYAHEQRLIVSTLRQYGILSLLTTPRQLSVSVINRYLEIKAES
ncbi:MAG: DUF58 domain-containing protein [Prevotella sp.]|nr:DUF58 domain-containing protein [Prevotella sp.]